MPIEIKRPGEPGGEKPKQSKYTEIFNRIAHALKEKLNLSETPKKPPKKK